MAAPERGRVPDQYKWNTRHLFPRDRAWEREREAVQKALPELVRFSGRLSGDAKKVRACLDTMFRLKRRLARLSSYAWRKHDEDTRVPRYQAMRELADKLEAEFRESAAFVQPELVSLPVATLRRLTRATQLRDYDRFLGEIARLKAHILPSPEERLLASASIMRDAGHTAYATFSAADLVFPCIEDERGRSVRIDQASFARYRASTDRSVRKQAFKALFGTYQHYRNTVASLLGAQVTANLVYAKARRYESALAAALDPDELAEPVYTQMLETSRRRRGVLERYLHFRRRLLGLRRLEYHDLYAPLVPKVAFKFPYEQARQLLVDAMSPLGPSYCRALDTGLDEKSGWIDLYPNRGKRSGAYMDGSCYDVHPFVLGNYLGDYNSLSMLAHEMGHAMHSQLSNASQPYSKADYSIFVAEVASTLNEELLADHLLGRQRSSKRKLFLLVEKLEGFRQTFFRQVLFAEFELELYRRAENGQALTADEMTRLYLEIVRRTYGHDHGLVRVDDSYGVEWAHIPHFYYNFYVFQYATGITAAKALAQRIRDEGVEARDRYLEHVLCAGGSDAPLELLKRAGVDLTTPDPYDRALDGFERDLEQAEHLAG